MPGYLSLRYACNTQITQRRDGDALQRSDVLYHRTDHPMYHTKWHVKIHLEVYSVR